VAKTVVSSTKRKALIGTLVMLIGLIAVFLAIDPIVQQGFNPWVRAALPACLLIGTLGTLRRMRLLRVFGWIGIIYYLLASTGFAFPDETSWGIRGRDIQSDLRILAIWVVGLAFVVCYRIVGKRD
jgi:hypothetical protein